MNVQKRSMDMDLGSLLPVPASHPVVKVNPFTEAQQAQLRAQIIVYGSLLRNQVPEETLMSLCFADIEQGICVDDFQEVDFRREVWQKIWQASSSKRVSVKAPAATKTSRPVKGVSQLKTHPSPPPPPPPKQAPASKPVQPSKPASSSKPAPTPKPATNKRKTAPADHKPAPKKQKLVKEKNISELQDEQPKASTTSEDDDAEAADLLEFAACAMKRLGESVDTADDRTESMQTDETETRQSDKVPAEFVEGVTVEVFSDEEGLHGVWFTGKIIGIRGGRLRVAYDDLLDEDGEEQLEEWVTVRASASTTPKVRLPHSITAVDIPIKDNNFSVGDHVDAWMNDGWWEGIIDRVSSDKKEVTLFFPGEGDHGKAKMCNLRPSLVWKDGNWVSWTPEPAVKKVRRTLPRFVKEVEVEIPDEEPILLVEGKRKREKPKRLADGVEEEHPPRKPYTRRSPRVTAESPVRKSAGTARTAKLKKLAAMRKSKKN